MRTLRVWILRFAGLFDKERRDLELMDEIQTNLEMHIEDNVRAGMTEEEARRLALIKFGGIEATKESYRHRRGLPALETAWRDVRYAVRMLRKSPAFTLVAVMTLALAIGANAVAFGALNALILRPLNVPNADSLRVIERASDKWGYQSYPNYLDLRDRNNAFDALAADNISEAGLDNGKYPSRVWLYEVSGNYFDVLGIHPYLGRLIHPSDEHGPDSAPYIVLAYAYWRSHFQGDPGVVGRVVQLDKHPFTIIGVAPRDFGGTVAFFSPDLFIPIVNQDQVDGTKLLNKRGNRWISELIGRLKAGVTSAQATADVDSIGSYLKKSYPKDVDETRFILVRPSPGSVFGGAVQAFLTALMLLAGLILLAACANLGNLFAARAADRSREVALRLALGSSRGRILRQLFTEAILISLLGGAAGLWGSILLLNWLTKWNPFPQFPLNMPLRPDAHVYGAALVLALASGFLFGAVPVKQVLQTDPYGIIKSGSNARAGRRISARDLLLAAQIAICAVLVTSSFVAVRGLVRSLHSNFGFEPQNAMLVETELQMAGYSGNGVPTMQRRMMDAMQTIPGVTSVGLVSSPPLHMGWETTIVYSDETADLRPSNAAASPIMFSISPNYFRAAETALLTGRDFTWHDDKGAPRVAVINQEFARKLYGSAKNAVGRYFKRRDGTRTQVVGIVQDGKYTANIAEETRPAMFLPILQEPTSDSWMVLRSKSDSRQLTAAIKAKLKNLDAGLPSFIQTWNEEMNGALFASRMAAISLGMLGVMGAMLSITGIFGLAARSVSKRKRELGIRMALGAQRKEVLKAALGRPFRLLTFGSAAGLLLGILASRVLAVIVYQATPRDPLVLAGVVLAMAMFGLVATWVPAQRALSIDPALLLREE
jgi:predicted permease